MPWGRGTLTCACTTKAGVQYWGGGKIVEQYHLIQDDGPKWSCPRSLRCPHVSSRRPRRPLVDNCREPRARCTPMCVPGGCSDGHVVPARLTTPHPCHVCAGTNGHQPVPVVTATPKGVLGGPATSPSGFPASSAPVSMYPPQAAGWRTQQGRTTVGRHHPILWRHNLVARLAPC
jgi:hypothetical protein